ncbi:MAG: hypothetical protein O3A01_05200 [bacterium]|nr:hypothetical protein [bacterium]
MSNKQTKLCITLGVTMAVLISPKMSLESSCAQTHPSGNMVIINSGTDPSIIWLNDQDHLRAYAREKGIKIRFVDDKGNTRQLAGVANGDAIFYTTHSNQSTVGLYQKGTVSQVAPLTTAAPPSMTSAVLVKLKQGISPTDNAIVRIVDQYDATPLKPVFVTKEKVPADSPLHQWFRTELSSKSASEQAIKAFQKSGKIGAVQYEKILTAH